MKMSPQMQAAIQMFKSGGSPLALVEMFSAQAQNNPMMTNLLTLAQEGRGADIEKIARNILSSQGYDFDKEFGEFIQTFK